MDPSLPYLAPSGVTTGFVIAILVLAAGTIVGTWGMIRVANSFEREGEGRWRNAIIGVIGGLATFIIIALVIAGASFGTPKIRDVEDLHRWAEARYELNLTGEDAERIAEMVQRITRPPGNGPVITEHGTVVSYVYDVQTDLLVLTDATGRELALRNP